MVGEVGAVVGAVVGEIGAVVGEIGAVVGEVGAVVGVVVVPSARRAPGQASWSISWRAASVIEPPSDG